MKLLLEPEIASNSEKLTSKLVEIASAHPSQPLLS